MFLLFAGDNYYPSGGWSDFRGVYLSEVQALNATNTEEFTSRNFDWWHIASLSTEAIVRYMGDKK